MAHIVYYEDIDSLEIILCIYKPTKCAFINERDEKL